MELSVHLIYMHYTQPWAQQNETDVLQMRRGEAALSCSMFGSFAKAPALEIPIWSKKSGDMLECYIAHHF